MRRGGLILILVLGVALVAMPFATSMFTRASAGEAMMTDFQPVMAPAAVKTTTGYYQLFKGVGSDFGPMMTQPNVAAFQGYLKGLDGMSADMQRFMASFATQIHMTPMQLQAYLGKHYPAMAQMLAGLPEMQSRMGGMVGTMSRDVAGFAQVSPALKHFQSLIGVMQRNVGNFAQANKLQPMGLLPWYFVAVGGLLILVSAGLLFAERRPAVRLAAIPAPEARAA
jgi:hypothetical protein